tara:strand:- start:1017 stop:1406 length:390 start_codon:yes stop_codon:yes gene_type:complete
MINVYKYDKDLHERLVSCKNKICVGLNVEVKMIKLMETLIGGYFSSKRLRFQLENLFSENNGWGWPDGVIIANNIYKLITKNRMFKYGIISIIEYQKLRRKKLVGIFKVDESKSKEKSIFNIICFYICY